MDFKQIQELIKIINKSNIGEIAIEEKDFKITIRQKEDASMFSTQMPVNVQQLSPVMGTQPGTLTIPNFAPSATVEIKAPDTFITIKSPMIGTFYRSASPDKPPFIIVGDDVSVGKPVCIIEAMKLFNEIESEVSGKIIKVLVDDASPVEYDQPLFLVEPA